MIFGNGLAVVRLGNARLVSEIVVGYPEGIRRTMI
jgi:hypothetical protein